MLIPRIFSIFHLVLSLHFFFSLPALVFISPSSNDWYRMLADPLEYMPPYLLTPVTATSSSPFLHVFPFDPLV
jgi:hypothetical protein